MRWLWIDRFLEFESGRRAVAIKNISLVEEQMDDYMPGFPVMPAPLIVEGIAQTAGLLVAEHSRFRERVVLAKLGRATFHLPAMAGDQLRYTAEIESIQADGAICRCTSHIGERLQAEVEVVFAHLDHAKFQGIDLFRPEELLHMLQMFQLFEVGRKSDGSPLDAPDEMLAAEQAVLAAGK